MEAKSSETKDIRAIGLPLNEVGVDNWALTREQTLFVFDRYMELKTPMLGGDVYELVEGHPRPNYDNWYCDRLENEDAESYVGRSIEVARAYVNGYLSNDSVFFVVVPGSV